MIKVDKHKETYYIRKPIVKRLEDYCKSKMHSKSVFADIAIEEKLNRELSPMLPENRITETNEIFGVKYKDKKHV